MVPDKFNMVDMGGIDLIMMQGEEVPGLYNRLVESIAQCRYQCLYNWLFDGVIIPPTYVELEVNENDEVAINEGVTVSPDDVIRIYSIAPPAPEPEIIPLLAEENGEYNVPAGVDGFNPVTVDVASYTPVINPISIIENGTYIPPSGVDGYSPVTVNVSGVMSNNDILFHFNDFKNSGKMNIAFYNKTGYLISDEQSKFGGASLKVNSAPATGGAVYLEGGFTLGNQDFTLDFWMYQTTNAVGSNCAFSFNYRSFAYYSTTDVKRGADCASNPNSWAIDRGGLNHSLSVVNGWHHVAVTRSGNVFHVFVDGNEEDTFEWSGSFAPMTRLSFGTNSNSETGWRGYIDEFRLKIGEAVWTNDFTPPTEPYV